MSIPHTFASFTFAIVSASPSEPSRSRLGALAAAEYLRARRAQVNFLDLRVIREVYPGPSEDAVRADLVRRFNEADGLVIAAPTYNFGPASALLNFFHFALDGTGRRYRPFVLVAGAGGTRSVLAFDVVARSLIHETYAVQVGPPVVIAGEAADLTAGCLDAETTARIHASMRALLHATAGSAALSSEAAAART